jgi:hypothetical protein
LIDKPKNKKTDSNKRPQSSESKVTSKDDKAKVASKDDKAKVTSKEDKAAQRSKSTKTIKTSNLNTFNYCPRIHTAEHLKKVMFFKFLVGVNEG